MTPSTTYCTILARNYLARALSLAESVRRHHPGSELVVLLIDVPSEHEIAPMDGVRCVSTAVLGLGEREVLDLATGYDLVEFATAVKPLLLRELLRDADNVVYLDPDTYLTAPLAELDGALAASRGGIVLTPHYLKPVAEGGEGHLLTVGIYNLGFCAVDRRAGPFLDWWWSHLKDECLYELLSGLFVDQKWMDLGSVFFHAAALEHHGYNVGIANLHERPIDADADGWFISSTGDRLRLFHFHSFDPASPDELSTRPDESTAHLRKANPALDNLCKEYAEVMSRHLAGLSDTPTYRYASDTEGRRISRPLRRAFRQDLRRGGSPPSPFLAAEASQFAAWRRSARLQVARNLVGDAGKAVRLALPDESARLQKRFPRLTGRVRSRYVDSSGMWG